MVKSREPFKFWGAPTIYVERLKLEWSNFVPRQATSSPSTRMTNHAWDGRGQGHVTHFKFFGPNDISGMAKARVVKFCTRIDCIKSELSVDKAPLKEGVVPLQ